VSLRGYMALGMLSAVLLPWLAYFALAPADEFVRLTAAGSLVIGLMGFVAWQIGRNVIKPLAAMSREARAIAVGDMGDGTLPTSKVQEIAAATAAFDAMRGALSESFRRQAALEAERRFIINAVAHDFTTPLFVLRGHLDGLSTGVAASPKKRAAYVAVCQEKVAHLERMVSDLRSLTRLEVLAEAMVQEPLDFTALVRQVTQAFEPAAIKDKVRLATDIAEASILVFGDRDWLERALSNVISNALRHTSQAGEVRIALAMDGGRARLRVEDTGDGVDPEAMPHIFEPFYRGNAARTSGDGGLGMGLAITKRVCQLHGGDVEVANRPGGGARFTLWIPLHGSGMRATR